MKKEDFVNYRLLDREVRQLRARLEALEDSIYSPAGQHYSLTPRASSGPSRTMDDAIAAHDALKCFYLEKMAEKAALQLTIELAIESLDVTAERLIMRYRYIDGYAWRRICNLMRPKGFSERQVYRLHGYALEKLKEVEV